MLTEQKADHPVATATPGLRLAEWQATRDTLHQFARIIGKIRAAHSPKSKHWWHITLHVSARGLTTRPFPISGQNLELTLDLTAQALIIESSDGWRGSLPLYRQSAGGLCRAIDSTLSAQGIALDPPVLIEFDNYERLTYDMLAADRYRRVLNWTATAFETFKAGLREETSPIQLFPHHMDLAMSWFSGRLAPGIDPADEESADEQLSFGFVTGDASVADAYFYATAYPAPTGWTDLSLPDGAYWHTEGWTGALLPYERLAASERPQALLLNYLSAALKHGKQLMA